MATLAEEKHTGEFLVSKANGTRSVDTGVILSGENVVVGELLGKVTASGKYAAYDNGAVDGRETVAGISYAAVDATAGDVSGAVIVVRDAEVRASDLTYNTVVAGEITTANEELKALGIIAR